MSLAKRILQLPIGTAPAEADQFLCVQSGDTRRLTFATLLTLFSTLNQGAWSGITTYTEGQIVEIGGSAYQCISTSLNQSPPNEDYWRLLVEKGAAGAPGSVWYYGSGVPLNEDGEDGDFYLRTTNSDVFVKGGGVWSIQANIEGPTGDSVEWRVQAGVPDDDDGENGDMSLNSTTGDVYGPKAAGVWGSIVANIKGADGAGVDLSTFVKIDGAHTATVDDLGVTIFTDADSSGYAQVNLPLLAGAIANGGSIRVQAAREWDGGTSYISVYANSSEWSPNRFRIGADDLFSLFSTGRGDYLELIPVEIDSVLYWQVVNFTGYWQDRD